MKWSHAVEITTWRGSNAKRKKKENSPNRPNPNVEGETPHSQHQWKSIPLVITQSTTTRKRSPKKWHPSSVECQKRDNRVLRKKSELFNQRSSSTQKTWTSWKTMIGVQVPTVANTMTTSWMLTPRCRSNESTKTIATCVMRLQKAYSNKFHLRNLVNNPRKKKKKRMMMNRLPAVSVGTHPTQRRTLCSSVAPALVALNSSIWRV